jgi:hypothetical protein
MVALARLLLESGVVRAGEGPVGGIVDGDESQGIGHSFLIIIDIFLFSCFSGWSIREYLV